MGSFGTLKIGIYCEFFADNSLGGREYIVAVLGELLSRQGHEVELVHHAPTLTAEEFTERFSTSRASIRFRYLPDKPPATMRKFFARRRARRLWDRSISEGYDCFVNIVHGIPVPCFAAQGVLIVLFPFFRPFEAWAGREIPGHGASRLWVILRHLTYRLQWRSRVSAYQIKTSISQYVQRWTERRWHLETSVLYPPSADSFTGGEKENLILSVGRFSGGHPTMVDKRQLEMMRVFREMAPVGEPVWRYISMGGLGLAERESAYFHGVERLTNANSEAMPNPSRALIGAAYAKAKIFWHAAGYGNDEEITPELSEHFGIATVDAMMCGCVPVVIKKGAQPEIVEHGVSGFLWESLDELKEQTAFLMHNPDRWSAMSTAAKERAESFSRERFETDFLRLLEARESP